MARVEGQQETHTRLIVPEDPDFAECTPQGKFPRLTDISPDFLAGLNAEHLVVDYDGTMVPYGRRDLGVSQEMLEWLKLINSDTRFKSLSIATEGGGFDEVDDLDRWGGIVLDAIYQPWVAGKLGRIGKEHPVFWRRILFQNDCLETPGKIVNIGDSPIHDIIPAQQSGIQAVQVDRLECRLLGFPARP